MPEVHSADSLRYLDPDLGRDAPEPLLAAASNILWKKVGRGELSQSEAEKIAADVGQSAINIHSMSPLFETALRIALATGRSAYDSIYLALADSLLTRLVTADGKLFNALKSGPYARLVLWIGDGP